MADGEPKLKKFRRELTGDELPKFLLFNGLTYKKRRKAGRPKKKGFQGRKSFGFEFVPVGHAGNNISYEEMYKIFEEDPAKIVFLDGETLPDPVVEEPQEQHPQDSPRSHQALVPFALSSSTEKSNFPSPPAILPTPTIFNISRNVNNFFLNESPQRNLKLLKSQLLSFAEEDEIVQEEEEEPQQLPVFSVEQPSDEPETEQNTEEEEQVVSQSSSATRDPIRQPPHLVEKVAQYFPKEGIVSEDKDGNICYWEKGGQKIFLLQELGEVLPVPPLEGNIGMDLTARRGKERAPQFSEHIPPRKLPDGAKLPHSCFFFEGLFRRTVRESTYRNRTVRQVTITKTPHQFTSATTLKKYLRAQYNRFPYYLFDFRGTSRCYCKPFK